MERLTKRDKDGNVIQMTVSSTGRPFHADEIWNKLATYEDLDEQKHLALVANDGCIICSDSDSTSGIVCYMPNKNGEAKNIPINYCPVCGIAV